MAAGDMGGALNRIFRRRDICGGLLAAVALPLFPATKTMAAGDALQVTQWIDLHAGSRIRMIAVGGRTVHAGIELQLADGWKTYWRMPGEAGVPPNFTWKGSKNLGAANVLYPAPRRLVDPAAESVGYKHSVLFPVEVRATDAKQPIALQVEIDFGLCKDICVPIQTTLAMKIAASGQAVEVPEMLQAALAQVPRPTNARRADDPEIVRLQASLDGPTPKLVVEARFPGGAMGADLFVEAPDSIFVPLPKPPEEGADGTMRFEIPLSASTAQDLRGKALTATIVSDAGAVEAPWKLP